MLPRIRALLKEVAYNQIRILTGRQLILLNPYISGKLVPFGEHIRGYIVPRSRTSAGSSKGNLPVPPPELREGDFDTEEDYLSYGRRDTTTMLNILNKAGESPPKLPRVLDFGCAAGRMLRFYPQVPGKSELWGVDISAEHIAWCQQHLSPPFLFSMSTTSPHLPFEDNYFDLVYSASVFTHISNLADAWFLELRRILRSGGYAYITIHDKRTVELLFTKYRRSHPIFVEEVRLFDKRTSVFSQDYACFSMGVEPRAQVFYDVSYLTQKWSRFARVLSVTPEAHDYQTAILLQK
jgi:SAM-dependent methyltransferase